MTEANSHPTQHDAKGVGRPRPTTYCNTDTKSKLEFTMQQTAAVVDQDLLNNTGSIAPSANNMEILYPVVSTHTMSLKRLDFSTFDGRFRLIIVSHLQL